MTEDPSNALVLIGARYKRGGETPAEGFDCFTLMQYVRRRYFNRSTPIVGIPATAMPSARAAAFAIYRTLGGKERIESDWHESAPVQGAAVAMGQWKVSRLHHCGVVINDGVLHALEHAGVVWTPFPRLISLYARVECFECAS